MQHIFLCLFQFACLASGGGAAGGRGRGKCNVPRDLKVERHVDGGKKENLL